MPNQRARDGRMRVDIERRETQSSGGSQACRDGRPGLAETDESDRGLIRH
jgi:hypothetical protein